MKFFTAFVCLLLLVQAGQVFSQQTAFKQTGFEQTGFIQTALEQTASREASPDLTEKRDAGGTIVHGLIAAGETLISHALFMAGNRIYGYSWASPNLRPIRYNLTVPWEWEDTDGFLVNNFGHPFQGALYFTAGRANGFGFYPSALFNTFGSFTWEAFAESNPASINDFYYTTISSMAAGEMIYRLYVEACASGIPWGLALFINPMAGLHRLITGWTPPDAPKNLYELRIFAGGGYANLNSEISNGAEKIFAYKGGFGDIGFRAIYGNPFEQDTMVPYRHFEFTLSFGMNPLKYMDTRLISDGYLFSFSPVYTEKDMMSTGLSLHLDYISQGDFSMFDSGNDQSGNALDWTIKYRHVFTGNVSAQAKLHGGFTFLGVSQYYSPLAGKKLLKHYGYGLNAKTYFSLDLTKFGRFEFSGLFYSLWTYPGTSEVSKGFVYWLFADLTYSCLITQHFSAGVTGFLALERGTYRGFPGTNKMNKTAKLFVAWEL